MNCPLDYSLCTQTATVYRLENNTVTRNTIRNCLFQWVHKQHFDTVGITMKNDFLMIVPGSTTDIRPGDRILYGEGPSITVIGWRDFVPENVPELVQVAYVKPCYWENEVCHLEVGSAQGGRL